MITNYIKLLMIIVTYVYEFQICLYRHTTKYKIIRFSKESLWFSSKFVYSIVISEVKFKRKILP